MCAFLSRPHQAYPHLFERRNISSLTGQRAYRAPRDSFSSPRKFPLSLRNKTFQTGSSYFCRPEQSNSSLLNIVAKPLGIAGFDSMQVKSIPTLSASNFSFQSPEILSLYLFLSDIFQDLTTIDALPFALVSAVLGIMAAFIVRQLKTEMENQISGLLPDKRESSPPVVSSSMGFGNPSGTETLEWINLSRPSPFFRSVCARCPSLSSSTAHQYVQSLSFKKPVVQRRCLPAPDGGMIALDWPSHLHIDGSKELENTLLIVCGTPEGSLEDGIAKFSQLVEQHGYFPIVFNPRGCGGSPLTTPRVFSAADSDDVRLAVQFIAKSRLGATLLSIGWGLGANVLARYLGEEGSDTPITAAVCIDNPFDLNAVARPNSGSRWLDYDHATSKGLVQILDSNKMLFQGDQKRFDVSGALAATSVRDFDEAISRVVHGYEFVEDFYYNNNSRAILEGVQIPLLCIQHLEDYEGPHACIPYSVFKSNVYTMLLVSKSANTRDDQPGTAAEWTHMISLEWLTAVEISMLKGRHPQLTEFSPNIKLPIEGSGVGIEDSGAAVEITDQNVADGVPGSTSASSYHKEGALEEPDTQTTEILASSNSHLQLEEEQLGRSGVLSRAFDGEGTHASESSEGPEDVQDSEQQLAGEALTEEDEAGNGRSPALSKTQEGLTEEEEAERRRSLGHSKAQEGHLEEEAAEGRSLTHSKAQERDTGEEEEEVDRAQSPVHPKAREGHIEEEEAGSGRNPVPSKPKDGHTEEEAERGHSPVHSKAEELHKEEEDKGGRRPVHFDVPEEVPEEHEEEEEAEKGQSPVHSKPREGHTEEQREIGQSSVHSETRKGHAEEEETEKSPTHSQAPDGQGTHASESSAGSEEGQDAQQESGGEELTEEEQAERGQIVQLTETVIHVLDVTMPGTLGDAKKQEVMKAVGRGENLVTALEEAVPEDVRGKISGAVSQVLQAQGVSQKLAGLGSQTPLPVLPVDVTSNFQKAVADLTGKKEAPKSDSNITQAVTQQISSSNIDSSSKKDQPSSTGGSQASADPSGTGSPNLKIPPNNQGDQGKNKEEDHHVDTPSTQSSDQSSNSQPPSPSITDVPADNSKSPVSSPGASSSPTPVDTSNSSPPTSTPPPDSPPPAPASPASANTADQSSTPPNPSPSSTPFDSSSPAPANPASPSPAPGNSPPAPANPASVNTADQSSTPPNPAPPSTTSDSSSPAPAKPASASPAPQNSSPAPPSPATGSSPLALADSDSANPAPQNPTPANPAPSSPPSGNSPPAPANPASQSPANPAPPSPPPDNSAAAPANPPPPSPSPDNSPPAPAPQTPTAANPTPGQLTPPPQQPPIALPSVGEALQALTGFDDATQMAVTNVFGVAEGVLDQLEKDRSSTDSSSPGDKLSQVTSEVKKQFIQNLPGASDSEDEDGDDEGTDDKESKEVKLASKDQNTGSHDQYVFEEKEKRNRLKSREFSGEGKPADPEAGSSRPAPSNGGVKPGLSKNNRGYINDSSSKGTNHEVHNAKPNSQMSPAQNVQDGSLAESASDERLKAMVDEIDSKGEAEGEKVTKSSSSDEVKADNSADGLNKDDSNVKSDQRSIVSELVMNALKLEIVRRLGAAGLEAVGIDLEKEAVKVASAVSDMVTSGKNKLLGEVSDELKNNDGEFGIQEKLGTLSENSVIKALGSVLGSNSVLGSLVPFGVLTGVVVAALGVTYLAVSDDQEEEAAQVKRGNNKNKLERSASTSGPVRPTPANITENVDVYENGEEWNEEWQEADELNGSALKHSNDGEETIEQTEESESQDGGQMMGAMAAAMGATAAVASSVPSTSEGQSVGQGGERKIPQIAEKAISMVAPVIPKTEAGELDQERLVALLTEVGQRGGPLTLVGKVALLWGGLRGAMSLADRLLSFFRIRERPLPQRLLGFGGMSIVLWTPVLVPLLPTLLQQWATKSPNGVADAAAGIGLYGAVFILVTIWGRRVRGYDRPLLSYGLELFSRVKLQQLAGGLAIGLSLVSGYYSLNMLLGYSQFAWDATVITSPDFPGALATTVLTSWKVLMLVCQNLSMAVALALVEEVLFRAWLQEEIAVDLGYDWAVLLSALAFAIIHWSAASVVGLWFFGMALSGARARTNGDLSFPIGIHAGVITAFSVVNQAGLVRYLPEIPIWITGPNPGNPLAGALGTGLVAGLAVLMYPRQTDRFVDMDEDED